MRPLQRVFLLMALLSAPLGLAQQPASPALKPLEFLSGRWVSSTATEVQEEIWSPPIGDSMLGSFRIVERGKPVFYEFWVVELENNLPVLKLKHFNPDLSGWEEKNQGIRMPVVSASANDVTFAQADGSVSLHYSRSGNQLTCVVHHVRKGQGSEESFSLTRVTTD